MTLKSIFIAGLFLVFATIKDCSSQSKISKRPVLVHYELDTNWSSENILGQPAGLGTDSRGNLVVFHRAGADKKRDPLTLIVENTIAILDPKTGKVLKEFGKDMFILPHGLTGDDELHFNRPTDVAVLPDGSFYVSDGYGNSRVIKFSKEGKFLFQWGEKGSGEGQFNLPHAVDLDEAGNVYVADRENGRIQKFDANGKFLAEWKNNEDAKVYAVQVSKRGHSIFAVDYLVKNDTVIIGSDISSFDTHLNRKSHFGRSGNYEGSVCRYHDIEVDTDENIYVADLLNNRIQKFQLIRKK